MKLTYTLPLFALLCGPTFASDYQAQMQAYFQTELAAWTTDANLIDAIRQQNATTAAYSQAQIDQMDLDWRAQVGQPDAALVATVLGNPAAEALRSRVNSTGGVVTEVFAMDQRGLNVAASHATSDYWQGDEDKFTHSFGLGAGAIHFGDIEFDESSQTYQGQVSVPIVDPETQAVIGAITFGLNAEALS